MVDYKSLENEKLDSVLSKEGLRVEEIAADGHCLFRSVSRQLHLLDGGDVLTVEYLRHLTAQYMLSHPQEFAAFLIAEDGELEDVQSYAARVTGKSPILWGGEPELVALSGALGRDIIVYSAESATWHAGVDISSDRSPLRLSYHKYYFGLGNHYNSVEPL